ncbi:hypothetical protein JTE90_020197 [Oedothorax gibbosus]|uniref:Uncharacterized protein n=1 Tax=Oedothorax gibbosus TaxID=931172 RepID=A0AAV6U1W3_9ARAC|nr:hypothetical protein JTE90_020197 [Oedothorax gibbosus]
MEKIWILSIYTNSVISIVLSLHGTDQNTNDPAVILMRNIQEKSNNADDSYQPQLSNDPGHPEFHIPKLRTYLRVNHNKSEKYRTNFQSSVQNNPGTRTDKNAVRQSYFSFPNTLLDGSRFYFRQNNHSFTNPLSHAQNSETSNGNFNDENQNINLHQTYQSQGSKNMFIRIPKNITNKQPSIHLTAKDDENKYGISPAYHVLNSKKIRRVPLVLITIHKEHPTQDGENIPSYFDVQQSENVNVVKETGKNFPKYGQPHEHTNSRDSGEATLNAMPRQQQTHSHINSGKTNRDETQTEIRNVVQSKKRFQYSIPMSISQDPQPGVWTPIGLKSYKASEQFIDGRNPEGIKNQYKDLHPQSPSMFQYILSNNENTESLPKNSLIYAPELTHPQNLRFLLDPNSPYSHTNNYEQRLQSELRQNVSMVNNFKSKIIIPLVYKAINENQNVKQSEPLISNNEIKSYINSDYAGRNQNSLKLTSESSFIEGNSNFNTITEPPVSYGGVKNPQFYDRNIETSAFSEKKSQKNSNGELSNNTNPIRFQHSQAANNILQRTRIGLSNPIFASTDTQTQQVISSLMYERPSDFLKIRSGKFVLEYEIESEPKINLNPIFTKMQNGDDSGRFISESRNFEKNHNNRNLNISPTNPSDGDSEQRYPVYPSNEARKIQTNYYDGYVTFPQVNTPKQNTGHMIQQNLDNTAAVFNPYDDLKNFPSKNPSNPYQNDGSVMQYETEQVVPNVLESHTSHARNNNNLPDIPRIHNSNAPLKNAMNSASVTHLSIDKLNESLFNTDEAGFAQYQSQFLPNNETTSQHISNEIKNSNWNVHDAPHQYYEEPTKLNGGQTNPSDARVPAEPPADSKNWTQESQQKPTAPLLLVLVTSKKKLLQDGGHNQDVQNTGSQTESSSEEIVQYLSRETNTKKLLAHFYKEVNDEAAKNPEK